MFGLGLWEIVAICLVALVFVRPEELPRVMRKLGRWYMRVSRSPRRMWHDFETKADGQPLNTEGGDPSISTTKTRETEETHT